MKTRSDYMEKRCTHREYYAQFVTPAIRQAVIRAFGVERLKKALAADEHLNCIPLSRWDSLPASVSIPKETGDWLSMAGRVCVLKEAARQVAEGAQ